MALERNLHPNAAAIRSADSQVQERMVRESFSVAIVHGMVFSLIALIAGFVLMLMIPAVKLRDRPTDRPPRKPAPNPTRARPWPPNTPARSFSI